MYTRTTVAVMLALSTAATASERDLDSHEHGAATLDVVIVRDQLVAAFESPWANLVGFEHEPSTEAQHEAVETAMATLEDGLQILGIDSSAECSLQAADLVSSMGEGEHDHDDEHAHGDDDHDDHGEEHDHDEEHDHADEKHAHGDEHDDEHHDEEHAHGDEHDHDDDHHDEEHAHGDEHDHGDEHAETHSEVSVNWTFTCGNIAAVSELNTSLFETFPGIETLAIQLAGPGGQSAQEATAANATVDLGAIR